MVRWRRRLFATIMLFFWVLPATLFAESAPPLSAADAGSTMDPYQQAAVNYAQEALQSALNFDSKSSPQKFVDAKMFFSDLGWNQFQMYMEGFGYWDIIKLKQLSVTCASLRPARILGQFYRFRIPMRGSIFWTFGLTHRDFTLDVDLTQIEQAPYFGIDSISLNPSDPAPDAIPFDQNFERIAMNSAPEIPVKKALTFVQQNMLEAFEGALKNNHFTAKGIDAFRYVVEKHLWRGKKSLRQGARFLGQVIVVELPIEIIFNSAQGATSDHLIVYEYIQPISPSFNGKKFAVSFFMAWQEHV